MYAKDSCFWNLIAKLCCAGRNNKSAKGKRLYTSLSFSQHGLYSTRFLKTANRATRKSSHILECLETICINSGKETSSEEARY
jgi:hypothetical protein